MGYTGATRSTDFVSGINILSSEHIQYMEVGVTLDAEAIGEKYLPIGTAIARNTTTGLFEEYDPAGAEFAEGFDEPGILNIDVRVDGEHNVVVGEVLIRASVYEVKLPGNIDAGFKKAMPMIRFVNNIVEE